MTDEDEQNDEHYSLNSNNLKKNIIIFIACLIVSFGIIILFFTDYIFNFQETVRNKTQSVYYFKWIILGFVLNIIFLIALHSMKSYKNNIVGEKGPRGISGRKGENAEKCIICNKSGDHDYEYELGEKFNKDKWKIK